jgi:Ni/Fe-hydrogenase 1 B-type cytochrome subunit
MFKRVFVWEVPVRVQHWLHVASIIVLTLTGIYIGSPFIGLAVGTTIGTEVTVQMRFAHFVAAWIFGLGFLVRFYWFFVGNRYARWRMWLPAGRRRLGELREMLKYYLFLRRDRPAYLGVNPISGLTYLTLGVLIVLQGITGIALYAEPFPSGFWKVTFGWILTLFGSQTVRLVHHALMYLFGAFLVVHLYMAALADVEEGNAPITSIISGWKFEPKGEKILGED